MSKKKELAFRKKKKNRWSAIMAFAIVAVFCGYMIIKGIALHNDKVRLQADIDNLNKQIKQEEQRSEDLKEYETYTHTKKYAEEVAKEVLGYVYKDEIVFKPE